MGEVWEKSLDGAPDFRHQGAAFPSAPGALTLILFLTLLILAMFTRTLYARA
jgi:hypothetical protein